MATVRSRYGHGLVTGWPSLPTPRVASAGSVPLRVRTASPSQAAPHDLVAALEGVPLRVVYGSQDDLIDVEPLLRAMPKRADDAVLCVPHHGHLDNLCAVDAASLVTPVVLRWVQEA